MPEPLVTAIIPTKDRAALCARAVESVLAQTYHSIECIVVDDGSSDSTHEMLSGRFGDRIHIVRNDVNQGVARARNQAIAMAQGKYIAFLDSDDEWLPAKIARQVEVAEKGADVVYCLALNVTPEGKAISVQRERRRGDLSRPLLVGNVIGPPSKVLLRRSSLDGIELFRPGIHFEDWELFARLSLRCRFDVVPEVLVRIEFDANSRHWSMTAQQHIDSQRAIYESLESDPLARELVRERRREIDAAIDYYTGVQLNIGGRHREAARYFLRSVRRYPLQLRAWRSLAVLATGPRVTAAAKRLRARLVSRRG